MENSFEFYVNADLVKSESDQRWMVGGLASTDAVDSQDESLDYNGFELSDLKWINWDHGKESKDLIGQIVTKSIRKGEGLYITGELFKSKEQAREAYQIMCDLNKSDTGNKLSWSVQGKVLERDPVNPKRVTKARLFQVALCPTPVNGDTWADLVSKGFSNKEDMFKSMDTEAVEPTVKESVEHSKKKLKEAEEEQEKIKEENKILTKSQVYKEIFFNFTSNPDAADDIYKLLTKMTKDITKDTVAKAMAILDLAKGEGYEKKTKKAEKEEPIEGMAEDEEEEDDTPEMEKGREMKKSQNEDLNKAEVANLQKSITDLTDLVKSQDKKFNALGELYLVEKENTEELSKSIKELTDRLQKVEETPIRKGLQVDEFKERFEKSSAADGTTTYDISNREHKNRLLDIMEAAAIQNGKVVDQVLSKGITELEALNSVSSAVQGKLKSMNISLVKSQR